jgi:CelD/BcsL family acetyltransferase involved in cellulose biosynthesis
MSAVTQKLSPGINGTEPAVSVIALERLHDIWRYAEPPLNWSCLFVLPPWLSAWWQVFGEGMEPEVLRVRKGERILGLAPLVVRDRSARLMGHPDVCDYLDVVVDPENTAQFFKSLLKYLVRRGIRRLDLGPLRPESPLLVKGSPMAAQTGNRVVCEKTEVAMELPLPTGWETYLQMLAGKQRHEIRRKLRRLHEAAAVRYRVVTGGDAMESALDRFLDLFGANRADKRVFMTDRMQLFFRQLARNMGAWQMLRLGLLELDGDPAAAVMCFDHRGTTYLYNNGYARKYRHLSVGLLSKALAIKDSIERGMKRFDLLKGGETYKRHLGGREIPLYRCRINL